jgi:hypothetical protein
VTTNVLLSLVCPFRYASYVFLTLADQTHMTKHAPN